LNTAKCRAGQGAVPGDAAADQAIVACGGDAREAVKALIVANHFLETELEKLRSRRDMRGQIAAA
jgi:hypothetical protein